MVTAAMKLKGTIFGRQAMTNLNSTLKSRDITLLTKAHLVKAMFFSVTMYGCESWPIKKAECWRIDAFELWCWKRLLRVPWTARRSNQSILKESVLNIHGNYWCWSWNSNTVATCCQKRTHWEKTWCWERLKAGGEGTTEDEMLGWNHRLVGDEFEQASVVGGGQGSLVCFSPWGCKESDTTEWLNWTEAISPWSEKYWGQRNRCDLARSASHASGGLSRQEACSPGSLSWARWEGWSQKKPLLAKEIYCSPPYICTQVMMHVHL